MTIWTPPSLPAGSVLTTEKLTQVTTQIQSLSDQECVLISNGTGVLNTTLINSNLSRPVAAGKRYKAYAVLGYNASTTGDFKPSLSLPSGSTVVLATLLSGPSNAASPQFPGDVYMGIDTALGSLSAPGAGTGASQGCVCYYHVVFTTTNSGSCVVQYAQASSDGANATTLRAGSSLWVREVEGV